MANVTVGKHFEEMAQRMVESGRYATISEVHREGLRLIEEREQRRAALDAALARGLADADAGRVRPIEEVRDELVAKFTRMAEERSL